MLGKYFKARKERKEKEAQVSQNSGAFTPLGIRLASSITISDLAYSMFKDLDTAIYKGDTYTIDYITEYKVFGDIQLFRVVIDSDCFLLIAETPGSKPDLMVFHKTFEDYPNSAAAWRDWIDPEDGFINAASMEAEGDEVYEEYWNSSQDVSATKYTPVGNETITYMHKMFFRNIELVDGTETEEFLLAECEDETKVCVYTGVTIPTIELTVL